MYRQKSVIFIIRKHVTDNTEYNDGYCSHNTYIHYVYIEHNESLINLKRFTAC